MIVTNGYNNFYNYLCDKMRLERGLRFEHSVAYITTVNSLKDHPMVLYKKRSKKRTSNLIFGDDSYVVWLNLSSNFYLNVEAWAKTETILNEVMDLIIEQYPEATTPSDNVSARFWFHSAEGPKFNTRNLTAPEWAGIRANYSSSTQGALDSLMVQGPTGVTGGKLILWHGPPGTGKSYAIRALARSWLPWCRLDYIVDPENLIGVHSDYLTTVMLDSDKPGWRLIVMEDTGELLAADAKARSGQGLSRLLNLCDGLLGQGLDLMVLITTNEELGKLHPAVIRPGRCLANVAFSELNSAEAREWGEAHGMVITEGGTLADLYNRGGQIVTKTEKRIVGFGNG